MLEHSVVVVDHACVVAVDEDLGVMWCVHDPDGPVGQSRSDGVLPVACRRIAVDAVRTTEVEVHAPTRTITVRPVSVRNHIRSRPIRPGDYLPCCKSRCCISRCCISPLLYLPLLYPRLSFPRLYVTAVVVSTVGLHASSGHGAALRLEALARCNSLLDSAR